LSQSSPVQFVLGRALLLALLAITLAFAPRLLRAENSGAAQEKNYTHTLTLADRLRISVYQEDDLTTLARLDARGHVNLPLLGEIKLGGLTVSEAQLVVKNAYIAGRFLRNPQVTISVEEYAIREVSVSGQVRSPGRYQLPNESTYTLAELITKAGGISDVGKGSAVLVTRILPDGSKKVFTVDVDSIIKGKTGHKADDNFLLQTGDNVYVPERLI
jgi:polysaccharide export outer membrane protein